MATVYRRGLANARRWRGCDQLADARTPPVRLFTGRYGFGGGLTMANYGVAPDGDHFILIKEQSRAILNVVLNWFDDVAAAVK
jgi:hypothetical protein